MVQAPGAMALFALRLVGLLTIEKALNEEKANHTGNSSLPLSLQYPFNLSITDINVTAPLFSPDPSFEGASRESPKALEEPSPTLKAPLEFVDEEPSSGVVEVEAKSSPEGGTVDVRETGTSKLRRVLTTTSKTPVVKEVTESSGTANRQEDVADRNHEEQTEEKLPEEKPTAGGALEEAQEDQEEQLEDPVGSSQGTDTKAQDLEGPVPPVPSTSPKKAHTNEGITTWDAARPSHNSPPGTQGLGKILDQEVEDSPSSVTHTKRRTKVLTKSSKPTVIHKIPIPQPLTGTPTPSHSPRPQPPINEGLIEDEDLFNLIDETQLWVPPTSRAKDDLEVGDESPEEAPPPTLSSRSLVSAIPRGSYYPRSSSAFEGSLPQEDLKEEEEEEEEEETKEEKEILPDKPPTATTDQPTSNPYPYPYGPDQRTNPFPYGPSKLPGYRNPYDEEYFRHIAEANKKPTQKPYYEYEDHEYEDMYYEYSESVQGRVHTEEPTVLFHFEKPGYSPKEPTTLAPPTRAPTPSDPWDCSPRCPRYELVDWNAEYDIRIYPRTAWVSTVIISSNRVLAELEGYMKVQDYFYGLNDRGLVLNLTVPFVTQIKFGKHPGVLEEVNDYTISLYVQPEYYRHSELPTPISNEVLLDEIEMKTVYVHNFEANVWDVTEDFLDKKATALMDQLRRNGEAFLDRYYYLASYGRPELYQPVYYELWVYATNFRDPQTPGKPLYAGTPPPANKITEKTLDKLCRGVECPMFEVLRTYKYGIQKRRYHNALFASTSPTDCEFTTMSVWRGFMPLHLYKHGINSHMEVIEATRPIALVHITESPDVTTECPQNMTMSLYLPSRLHSNPPITGYGAPNVRITTLDNVVVYAYTVGGYLLDPVRVRKELSDLKYRLTEFGACYREYEYYVVVYDFIVRYHGRQNEIWIMAENCRATHNG